MPRRLTCLLGGLCLLVPATLACSSNNSGSGPRRVVQIVQTDDGCTPDNVAVAPGEALRFEVRNDGKKDHEVEGISGTKFEETTVPAGRTRNVDYTAPSKPGQQQVKCYIPKGATTIIQINVGAAPAATPAR